MLRESNFASDKSAFLTTQASMNGQQAGQGGLPDASNFDFSALHDVLSDPNIKNMAEQIAQNPAFVQMSQALQASMAEGQENTEEGPGRTLNPQQYAEAMSSVLGNPEFMQMAEQLGQQIMTQDPGMSKLMEQMQSNDYRETINSKMAELKDDPEVAPILKEIEEGGPAAMMKYWNDPEVLEKLSKAMGPAFGDVAPAMNNLAKGEEQDEDEEGEEEEEEIKDVLDAASRGSETVLKELIDGGNDVNLQDEEGRTALHFSCGYGEIECAKILLAAKASIDLLDNNNNTPLHYAAGYGQEEAVALLLQHQAKVDAKNNDGKTASQVAALNERQEIVSLIEQHEKKAKA